MQNHDKIIVCMISDAGVMIKNALYLDSFKKSIFPNINSNDEEKQLYKSRENLCSKLYIEASENLLRIIYDLDSKKYNDEDNIYELYMNLSDDQKNAIYDNIYQKYNQLFELRNNLRKEKIYKDNKVNNDIDLKLKKNIELRNTKSSVMDSDFLKKFTIGLNRYFINNYLFTGKLLNIQKQYNIEESIDILRNVIDEEDAKFRKLLSNSKLVGSESIIL